MLTTEPVALRQTGAESPDPPPVIRVDATHRDLSLRLQELWEYRELLYFLVWRDVKVRYKQTALGVTWVILQPLMAMVVFSLIFGRLAKIPSDGIPYPLFTYTALVAWMLFSSAMSHSSGSLVNNANLITKVYFPRLIIPLASLLTGLVDSALQFLLLLAMMFYYGVTPRASSCWVIPFLLLAVITSLGVGLWLAALNVRYRDVSYIVPFLTQFWLFATPVAYSSSLVHGRWRIIFGLNPMAGVVDGFRWSLLGTQQLSLPMVAVSSLVGLVTLASSLVYFRRTEQGFADIV